MLAVNFRMVKYLINIFIFTVLIGCAQKSVLLPTYNQGRYSFQLYHSKELENQKMTYVGGSIVDLESKKMLTGSIVEFGCLKAYPEDGLYEFRLGKTNVSTPVEAKAIGYLSIFTAPCKLNDGDSLVVNFYLAEDKRPIINCENP
jgi:hypothetical protein